MFQNFTSSSNTSHGPDRLIELRKIMANENVTAFLIPHADEHQNEYLPARAERLAWLTGFTGSAGFCIATLDQAIVFTDGRYTVQINEQINKTVFTAENSVENPPSKWLEENMDAKDIIAYDPWLITINQLKTYEKAAKKTESALKPVENLIDQVWSDQPAPPVGSVSIHDVKFAGKSASDKISEIQKSIVETSSDFTILTDPASLAWLFNIRGNDLIHNPLVLGYAIIPADGKPLIFMDAQKLNETALDHLNGISIVHPPSNFENKLRELSNSKKVLCDADRVSVALAQIIEQAGGKIVHGRDPVILPRAMKNQTECTGTRIAHVRDGVAMAKFLCWLDQQDAGSITEIDAAKKLEVIRASNAEGMQSSLKEISFDTISASGPHAALPHYRVNETSNSKLSGGEIYLVDSGAQYDDGTTDITRTIAIGTPPKEAITDFTLVLKGHIAIDQARFPKGTRGIDLDVLARNALWQHGKDYAHGTGHGVGSYMNVHEGPQGIHRRAMEPLQPGMIISNEPGYYVEGKYGIRIENLVLVTSAEDIGGNIDTHSFENLTWAPIDSRLIDVSLLLDHEVEWLNHYHSKVLEIVGAFLKDAELDWLTQATRAL